MTINMNSLSPSLHIPNIYISWLALAARFVPSTTDSVLPSPIMRHYVHTRGPINYKCISSETEKI